LEGRVRGKSNPSREEKARFRERHSFEDYGCLLGLESGTDFFLETEGEKLISALGGWRGRFLGGKRQLRWRVKKKAEREKSGGLGKFHGRDAPRGAKRGCDKGGGEKKTGNLKRKAGGRQGSTRGRRGREAWEDSFSSILRKIKKDLKSGFYFQMGGNRGWGAF